MDRYLGTKISESEQIKKQIRNKENVISLRTNIPSEHLSLFDNYLNESQVKDKLFIASSGTTSSGQTKIFEISHDMMMNHAREICRLFKLNSNIVYLNTLPLYYMGGISIIYRELTGRFKTHHFSHWNKDSFLEKASELSSGKLDIWSSLVPTQLFDIYKSQMDLRDFKGVFLGGDRLNSSLKSKVLENQDCVFETYGASEFCSQIATSKVDLNQGIELLPFVKLTQSNDHNDSRQTYIQTPFHYDSIHMIDSQGIVSNSYSNKLLDGRYPLSDQLEINQSRILIKGRRDDFIKINSQFVSLLEVEDRLRKHIIDKSVFLKESDFFITSVSHERKGNEVAIVCKQPKSALSKDFEHKLKELHISTFIYTKDFHYNTSGKLMRKSELYLNRSSL